MLLGEIANNLSVRLDRAEAQGLWLTPMGHAEEVLLRRRFAKGELASPFRGMYARCNTFETASIRERAIRTIRTLGLLHPSWVFCGYSAAVIHGLQVPNTVLGSVHYCANGTSHRGSPLIRHHLRLAPQDIVSNTGVRVTSLRKTLVDCLCTSDFHVGLVITDSAIHWELAGKREIECWIEKDGKGRRGIRQARETVAWADGRSENGGESIARATMIKLGFVAPYLQVEVFDPMEPDNPKRGDFGCISRADGPAGTPQRAGRGPRRHSRDPAAAQLGLRSDDGPAGAPRRPNTREARWQPRAIGLPSDKPLRAIDATPARHQGGGTSPGRQERHRGRLERHRAIRT